jgi:hypothetical protein
MPRLVVLIACALVASACRPAPPTPVPPDTTIVDVVIVDAAPDPPPAAPEAGPLDAGDVFDRACANLRDKQCKEGFQLPGEEPCADIMRRAELGHLTQMHPDCVEQALSVAAIRKCGPYCRTLVR